MSLPRSTPEAEGVGTAALTALVAELDARLDSMHSLVLVRHGHVIAEAGWAPYSPDVAHVMFSVSKSFTSTAVGFAVQEGLLTLDDRVVDHFPGQVPADADPRAAALRVRDVLTMAVGRDADSLEPMFRASDGDWVRAFFAAPWHHDPGTNFHYDTGASFVLSALVQKLTGQRLLDYLEPRLFTPLGIRDRWWEQNPEGIDLGGYGLGLRTDDLATFGQWLLQRGRWGDRQLLPAEWIDEATAGHIDNSATSDAYDWRLGYGYQFWRSRHGYRGDGAFGQFCLVLPEHDAVLAITGSLPDMQAALDIVWQRLIPAFGDAPLAEDPDAAAAFAAQAAALEVKAPTGASAPASPSVLGVRYALEGATGMQVVRVEADGDETVVTFERDGAQHPITFGYDRWRLGDTELRPDDRTAIAARGAWQGDTFRGRVVNPDGPFGVDDELVFEGDRVEFRERELVSFDPITTQVSTGSVAAD